MHTLSCVVTSERDQEVISSPSADVVFVIEERSCNSDIANKLESISRSVDAALTAKRLTNNRYAVVGFGGAGVHDAAHTHTVNSQVFGSIDDVSRAEAALMFSDDGRNTDSLQALDLALMYPFRSGAAKTVVMITCTAACDSQSLSASTMQHRLNDADVTLHVLVEHEFEMESYQDQPQADNLFGKQQPSITLRVLKYIVVYHFNSTTSRVIHAVNFFFIVARRMHVISDVTAFHELIIITRNRPVGGFHKE